MGYCYQGLLTKCVNFVYLHIFSELLNVSIQSVGLFSIPPSKDNTSTWQYKGGESCIRVDRHKSPSWRLGGAVNSKHFIFVPMVWGQISEYSNYLCFVAKIVYIEWKHENKVLLTEIWPCPMKILGVL